MRRLHTAPRMPPQVRAIANVAFDPEQAKVVFAAGAVASVVSLLASSSVRVQL